MRRSRDMEWAESIREMAEEINLFSIAARIGLSVILPGWGPR